VCGGNEIRRKEGVYSLYQQGTFNPDSVNRWMGSVAMDKHGNIALGTVSSDAVSVKPGIRYTGRLAGDPLGQMTLGEATLIKRHGVQVTTNNRPGGDYTSLNLDPDGCTFWYNRRYYQIDGIIGVNTAPWQTRIEASNCRLQLAAHLNKKDALNSRRLFFFAGNPYQ